MRNGEVVISRLDGSQPIVREHLKRVGHVSFSPDGQRIVACSEEGQAAVYATSNGIPLLAPLKHQREVVAGHFSPDGRLLLTGGFDGQLRIWNAANGQPEISTLPHGNQLIMARFFPDGHRIVTACYHGSVRIWDLAGLRWPEKIPRGFNYVAADRWLDRTARPAALATPDRSHTIPFVTPHEIRSWAQTTDSRYLLSLMSPARDRWSVQVWDSRTGTSIGAPIEGEGRDPTVFPGLRSFSIGVSNTVQSFSLPEGRPSHPPLTVPTLVTKVTPPDQPWLAVAHGNQVTLFHPAKGLRQVLSHDLRAWGASFDPAGSRVVTWTHTQGFDACYAQVWEVATGRPIGPRVQHLDGVHRVVWSLRGDKIVTASEDGTGFIWDVAAEGRVGTVLRHEDQIVDVELSQEGNHILTAGKDRAIRIWDFATGLPLSPRVPLTWDLTNATWQAEQGVITEVGGDQWVWHRSEAKHDANYYTRLSKFLRADPGLLKARPQDVDPLLSLWEQLKAEDPDRFRVSNEEILRWHSFQADLASTSRQYQSELFHLDHLLKLAPDLPGVKAQRERSIERARKSRQH